MPEPVDQRLVRLVRQLDEERRLRIKFERMAGTLRTTVAKMKKQRTADFEAETVNTSMRRPGKAR